MGEDRLEQKRRSWGHITHSSKMWPESVEHPRESWQSWGTEQFVPLGATGCLCFLHTLCDSPVWIKSPQKWRAAGLPLPMRTSVHLCSTELTGRQAPGHLYILTLSWRQFPDSLRDTHLRVSTAGLLSFLLRQGIPASLYEGNAKRPFPMVRGDERQGQRQRRGDRWTDRQRQVKERGGESSTVKMTGSAWEDQGSILSTPGNNDLYNHL